MITTDNIGFKLIIAEPDVAERTVVVCPRYDNLKLKDSKPSGEMYYKKDLSGTIKFLGVDFWTIYNCALRTKFTLVVYQHGKGEVVRATFRKTDCKWDVNHKIATVDIQADDPYKKIEDNKDNEYNLVKLGLEKKALSLYVYPQNQVYFQEDNIISLWGAEGFVPQPQVTETHNIESLQIMGFGDGIIVGALCDERSNQRYYFKKQWGDMSERFVMNDGAVFMGAHIGEYLWPNSGASWSLWFGYYKTPTSTIYQWYNNLSFGFVLWNNIIGSTRYELASFHLDSLYAANNIIYDTGSYVFRMKCRLWVPFWGTVTSHLAGGFEVIRDGDITASINNNYKSRGYEYRGNYTINNVIDKISISTRTSPQDKGYGRVEGTATYYDTPDDSHKWMPVKKDSWFGGISIWIRDFYLERNALSLLSADKSVNDFYFFGDIIKAVVNEIDSGITFDTDETHSQFLFARTNPVSGQTQGGLYVSQKSNILKLDYDYPAWLAPVTWGKIETLLKNAFNCYWDLYERDGATHLRIEHRTFYDRGGTYTDNDPRETHDLRTVYRNSTPYSYAEKTNRWEWDKDGNGDSTASRYEYSWMDTQTEMFDGKTIEVPEEYRLFDDDKLEDRKVDWFSSDIDFLVSVTSECSSDGFAIVMESLDRPGWIISGNENYAGQNYELSLEYLQPKYLLAGIYSPVVKIGNTEVQNTVTARLRKAEVDFRLLQGEDVEAGDILITEVGEGLIDSLEKDLHSGKMTATVRYENE